MKFGEKVKKLRKEKKLTQSELGAKIGVSGRSVAAYEEGASYPRYQKTYAALAAVLGVDENYLRTEDEVFMEEVGQLYGEDQLSFLLEMQELYLDAKRRAQKFTPRKYARRGTEE